ncbi:MAG: protein of unknown function Meta and HslJ [Humibacillus sp.]|nr:protein of unknown function Meta and HslJ [Humibacillus sp.]
MADDEVTGTSWVLERVGGEPVTGTAPVLDLGADGRVGGSTGVNRLIGTYAVDGPVLRFGALATTRMAGPPEAMALEQAWLAVLVEEVPFTVTDGRLVLAPGTASAPAGAELVRAPSTET